MCTFGAKQSNRQTYLSSESGTDEASVWMMPFFTCRRRGNGTGTNATAAVITVTNATDEHFHTIRTFSL